MSDAAPSIAVVGLGELGSTLAAGLGRSGAAVRVFTRPRAGAEGRRAIEVRLAETGAVGCESLEGAARGAAAVLAAVPASASTDVALAGAPHLERGALYADLSAAAPADKRDAAAHVAASGALYVDAAVLGTVAMSGLGVPILASGPGAERFRELMAPLGMRVTAIDAPPGHASLVKLLRSVFMKGRDALVLEMVLAAQRYGLEDVVIDSIEGPGERVPFRALAERVLSALAVHAGRRADELAASSEVLADAGVAPVVTDASAERLRRLADSGIREAFGGERPGDAREVLRALERLSASVGDR